MRHDPEQGLAFLRLLYPRGPWVMTAIDPDRDEINTATFRPETEVNFRSWLESHNNHNIYYSVNRVQGDMSKKAGRVNIDSVTYLHVDVDPRAGEDFLDERERILKLINDLPPGLPRPTAVVDSGGGYNALWKLADPIETGGDLDKAEQAKRYNIQLELLLGGDNCHNIDRILRLPGSINFPNKKKRRKGRVITNASLLWFDLSVVYPLSTFTAAPLVQAKTDGGGIASATARRIQISGNVRRLQDVHELPDAVSAEMKVLIVQGEYPDDPQRYPSRSEALFAVCCSLVRAGCTDDVIFSVITDPDFRISESVLELRSSAEKYALRQIAQAREEAESPHLRVLNSKHAVIANMGGRCRVVEEQIDEVHGRHRLTKQSFEDFRNRYLHIQVEVGKDAHGKAVMQRLGAWWLFHPLRRQYDSIVFAPGREVEGAYNLWRGFACQAIPGNCSLLLEHIRSNVCRGNEEYYQYVLSWMARAVQNPASPGETAIVLRGRMGTGKGMLARMFGQLWGRHYYQITDPKHLVGNFNLHLRDCVFLFADEAFYAGDKKHESLLKAIITEPMIMIEGKGVDVEAFPNCTHLMMASNSNWVVPAGPEERRYMVLDVAEDHMQDDEYFHAIEQQQAAGGREALLHFLMNRDLKGFNVRRVPKTDALREQKILSLSSEEEWWFKKLEEGILLGDHQSWTADVLKELLMSDYLSYAQRLALNRRANSTAMGRFLKRMTGEGLKSFQATRTLQDDRGRARKERAYYYQFPALDACRARWEELYNGSAKYDWPRPEIRPDDPMPHEVM